MLCRICIVQIQLRKPALDLADYTAPTERHKLDNTHQESICPERSRSSSVNRLYRSSVRGVQVSASADAATAVLLLHRSGYGSQKQHTSHEKHRFAAVPKKQRVHLLWLRKTNMYTFLVRCCSVLCCVSLFHRFLCWGRSLVSLASMGHTALRKS